MKPLTEISSFYPAGDLANKWILQKKAQQLGLHTFSIRWYMELSNCECMATHVWLIIEKSYWKLFSEVLYSCGKFGHCMSKNGKCWSTWYFWQIVIHFRKHRGRCDFIVSFKNAEHPVFQTECGFVQPVKHLTTRLVCLIVFCSFLANSCLPTKKLAKGKTAGWEFDGHSSWESDHTSSNILKKFYNVFIFGFSVLVMRRTAAW